MNLRSARVRAYIVNFEYEDLLRKTYASFIATSRIKQGSRVWGCGSLLAIVLVS